MPHRLSQLDMRGTPAPAASGALVYPITKGCFTDLYRRENGFVGGFLDTRITGDRHYSRRPWSEPIYLNSSGFDSLAVPRMTMGASGW